MSFTPVCKACPSLRIISQNATLIMYVDSLFLRIHIPRFWHHSTKSFSSARCVWSLTSTRNNENTLANLLFCLQAMKKWSEAWDTVTSILKPMSINYWHIPVMLELKKIKWCNRKYSQTPIQNSFSRKALYTLNGQKS